jgi:hypothetical protein
MGNILDGRGKGGVVFLGDYVTLPASSGAPDGLLPPLGSIRFNPLLEELEVFRDDLKNGYEWRLLNAQTIDIAQFYSKNGGPISGNITLSNRLLATAGTQSAPSISFAFSRGTGLSTAGGALRLSSNGSLVATMTTNSITLIPEVKGHAADFDTLTATTLNADVVTPVPFESAFFVPGTHTDATVIHRMPATHVLRFASAFAGWQAFAGVAPVTPTSITVKKIGSSGSETIVGSVNWYADNRVGHFLCPDPFTVNAGESLVFITAEPFDDVISDISITIAGQSIYRLDSAPTDILITGPQAVDEHSSEGTYIATISAVDADDTQFSYSLVSQSTKERRFNVVGNQIVWGSFPHLIATSGWPGAYRPVTVRATDPQGKYIQKTFQILVKDVIFGVVDGDINIPGVTSHVPSFAMTTVVGSIANASGTNSFPIPSQTATANAFGSVNQTTTIPAIDGAGSGLVTVTSATTSLIDNVLSDTGGAVENLGSASNSIGELAINVALLVYDAGSADQTVDAFTSVGSGNDYATAVTTTVTPAIISAATGLLLLSATASDQIGPFLAAEDIGSGDDQIGDFAVTASQGYVDLIQGSGVSNVAYVSSTSSSTVLVQGIATPAIDQFISVNDEDTVGSLSGTSQVDAVAATGVGTIQIVASSTTLSPNFADTTLVEVSNTASATRGIGLFTLASSFQSLATLVGTDNINPFTQVADQKVRGLATDSIGTFSFPVRANYASFSEAFFSPSSAVTISTNALAEPLNGTQSAERINEINDSAPDYHSVTNTFWTSGFITNTPVTFSVYGKSTGANARGVLTRVVGSDGSSMYIGYDLTNGTVTIPGAATGSFTYTSTTVTAVNGWYRISMSGTFNGPAESLSGEFYIIKPDAPQPNLYQGAAGNGIGLWGAQLEYTTAPTVYLPAQGSTVAYEYIMRNLNTATISENISPFSLSATAHAV